MYLCAKTKMPKSSDSEISVISQESPKVMKSLNNVSAEEQEKIVCFQPSSDQQATRSSK